MSALLTRTTALGYDDLVLLVAEHAELLAAARATIAAAALGEGDPLIHLRHALAAHGQLPPAGARPVVLLARCSAPTVLPRCLIGEVS
uniref:hypothetical protein n=1 Tax=Streptosporangium sp. CA-256172 TaxID=3240076 RepID=UPI003F49B386